MEAVPEARYLAEWYLPDLDGHALDAMIAKLEAAAATVTVAGTAVRLLITLAVPTDEVFYGVFGADSADVVSTTCLRAGLPHQRLSSRVDTRIATPRTASIAGLPAGGTAYRRSARRGPADQMGRCPAGS